MLLSRLTAPLALSLLATFVACDADDTPLLAESAPAITVIDGLVAPGAVAPAGAALVSSARATEARLAEYRAGQTAGITALDPESFARDLTDVYNVNYGDLGLELPEQTIDLRTVPLEDPAQFSPADAVALDDAVRDFVRETAAAYDADAVQIRFVRVVLVGAYRDLPAGFNVYVNLGIAPVTAAALAPSDDLPWTLGFGDRDDEIDCPGEIGVDAYVATQQNLALARQLRTDAREAGVRGGRILADFAGAALVTPVAELGTQIEGQSLDADLLLQSTRFPRALGGEIGPSARPDFANDFPEAGQYLVHFDAQALPGSGSGEVCMSPGKALQYARDYTTLDEVTVMDQWRQTTGVNDAEVRRVAADVGAFYSFTADNIERRRAHIAYFLYGKAYTVQEPAVGRLP